MMDTINTLSASSEQRARTVTWWPPFDPAQRQVLHGIEADGPHLEREGVGKGPSGLSYRFKVRRDPQTSLAGRPGILGRTSLTV